MRSIFELQSEYLKLGVNKVPVRHQHAHLVLRFKCHTG